MKKILLVSFVLTLFLLCGCFPTGKPKDSAIKVKEPRSDLNIPDAIDMELDKNLTVNAKVKVSETDHLSITAITLKHFDENLVKNTLLENKMVATTDEDPNFLHPDYKDITILTTDESYLRMEVGGIFYEDAYYSEREYDSNIMGTSYFIRSDLKNVFKKSSLADLNKDEAIEKVRNAVNQVGISQLGSPDVIALDFETLESEWEDYEGKHGKHPRKWEKDDEAYVVIFPVQYHNTNITNKGYFNADSQLPVIGSRIMGVVNKRGLIAFTASGIYEVGEKKNDHITPISLKTALQLVKDKYKDVIISDPIDIFNIALEYVPTVSNTNNITYELVPAWVFTGRQEVTFNSKEGSTKGFAEFTIMIHAETGQEIRIGGPY
ncbi:hypothetical protein K0H71_07555 [Bacillus sp. IITD106]|nr:hypothetical protein [Bacillus sp. IITD106]